MGAILLGPVAATAGPLPAVAAPAQEAAGGSSLVMVLDSSGSMADDDGTGRTRMESARGAVSTVVDTLPDGYPTGLRVYGADRPKGCTDTRLVRPVQPLDRDAMKRAVDGVQPKGDTPIGLSLRKAAQDLPEPAERSLGRRTILLISDGEDNCGTPQPCEVARQLGEDGVDLRIDAIGFQVRGKAREQLECVAEAGHGSYYDAPDAEALARQLQRASQLSAHGYRFMGERVEGGASVSGAAGIGPGQYTDTIGPGETRWYAAGLDAGSAADLAVTAVPQPGVKAAYGDGIELELTATGKFGSTCDSARENFAQDEGAMVLSTAVSRVPSADGGRSCDPAGKYLLSVHRTSAAGSDRARWPFELRYGTEKPLAKGTVPAQSATEYGAAGRDAMPPAGDPKDIEGGTGFNDARTLDKGVWRDKLLPAQTRWYKVKVGWGQQLRYAVDFGNEPTLEEGGSDFSFVDTAAFSAGRKPIGGGSEFNEHRMYSGKPAAVDLGTVPVTWTNRWESATQVVPVRAAGEYYVAVSLGPNAAKFAENAAIGVVLRVDVAGRELAGPQHDAPALAKADGDAGGDAGGEADKKGDAAAPGDSGGAAGAGWTGIATAAAVGGAVVLLAGLVFVTVRRRAAKATTRGGA
ncbi:VWA domain-containing protein [Streptomyces sp. H27-C3]|uniref:vWA domain-containing protein n=1 Tax=Streptomyces sp. H27-C3 TaxID=3046305 RepID=UPI0024BBD16F|nr:VWA domain-containing protein [Streptomyces sp. H27-C3]MDJ0462089.1 VWA domain-containing protein [Streptomyces sp. H27-C3]